MHDLGVSDEAARIFQRLIALEELPVEAAEEIQEPSKMSGFLFGAWDTPEWMLAGGDFRMMLLVSKAGASGGAAAPAHGRFDRNHRGVLPAL